MRESLTGHCRRINCRQTIDLPGSVRRVGTSTEASDPAGMSHLRNVRARQPRRRCVRSEAGRPAARVRVVLSLAAVRGPGYNVSRKNDVPTAERAGSDARGCDVNGNQRDQVSSAVVVDEGGPLEVGVQKLTSNQAVLLWSKRSWW